MDFIKECIVWQMEVVKSRQEDEVLMQLGEVMFISCVKLMMLFFFDVKVVVGFFIFLNNDELVQDIEVLKMLCLYLDFLYLI